LLDDPHDLAAFAAAVHTACLARPAGADGEWAGGRRERGSATSSLSLCAACSDYLGHPKVNFQFCPFWLRRAPGSAPRLL
jgi:hypothetical protein